MYLAFIFGEELAAAVDQQSAEEIDHKLEPLQDRDSDDDKAEAENQSANDPPKQDLVLMFFRDAEVLEEHEEDEEIVHAHRFFDHVAGYKLESRMSAVPKIDKHSETSGKADPEGAPGEGLFHAHHAGIAVKHAQVEHQHEGNENIEAHPEVERVRHADLEYQSYFSRPRLPLCH